jgi:outer membrane protein OmpA-like peptidoglycan-associated protein
VAFSPSQGQTITLDNVFFAPNKSELLPSSFRELDKLVNYLSNDQSVTISVLGHTDNTGEEPQNQKLSEARALAIASYLVSKNIDASRISSRGYGSSKPVAENDTEEGRQKNRRVEFVISAN